MYLLLYALTGGVLCINFGKNGDLTQSLHLSDKSGPLYRSSLDECGDSTTKGGYPPNFRAKSYKTKYNCLKNQRKNAYIRAPERVLLFDATGLAYRCFFALPELKTHRGTDIACLMGFMNTLSRLHRLYHPKYLGIVFDSPGANNPKREIWPEYKKNRQIISDSFKTQLTWIREFCAILGLPVFIQKFTEADDIITSIIGFLRGENSGEDEEAYRPIVMDGKGIVPGKAKVRGIFDKFEQELRKQAPPVKISSGNEPAENKKNMLNENGYDVTVVTADKDLLQILSNNGTGNVNVKIVQPHKSYRVVTENTVRTEYGIEPERFSEYLALVGDASDNIPGVMGVGPKTAPKLIAKYNTFEEIISSPEIKKLGEKGGKYSESIRMAYDFHNIVRLKRNLHILDSTNELIKEKTLSCQFYSFLRIFSLQKAACKWTNITGI
ncbi:5'-3' exonuclease, putative [Theileria equi strain WA]|uniref:5'-3' exonuclease, putative n=1 Tax=Theileria equi strain WA TaxID=1537102 RepID=L0AW50_THEEQ|nr:5'-3' exonuclease, putative [Theileria equi strain WA]AFZ79453.1 5'-3' exonuclease, putative [Theileria equi strain WA]|eukprot:XP_004829119.1 5'-3' exonuclease, putative [Theileria equi strain WA]